MSIQDSERAPLVIERPSTITMERSTPCILTKKQSTTTTRARRALTGTICFCFCFMIAEFVGGVYTHSLAVLNDAVHLLTDVATLTLSLIAVHASTWSGNGHYTFGWQRAEVVGALASVFTTWGLVVWIFIESITRAITILKCADGDTGEDCFSIDAPVMMYIGIAGFCVNICCALILHWGGHHGHSHGSLGGGHGHDDHGRGHDDHGHSHGCDHDDHGHGHDDHGHSHDDHGHGHDDHGHDDHGHGHDDHGHGHDDHGHGHDDHGHGHDDHGHGNMNLRGAFLHVIGDCLQSLGVVLAAGFIWGMNNRYHNDPASARSYANLADPCCSVLFGVITMFTTINLFRDIFRVLMQCTPRGIDYDKVLSELKEVPNVRAVQDLHLWSLGSEDSVLMAHLVVSGNSEMAVLKKVMKDSESVGKRCKVDHVTIQLVFDDQ